MSEVSLHSLGDPLDGDTLGEAIAPVAELFLKEGGANLSLAETFFRRFVVGGRTLRSREPSVSSEQYRNVVPGDDCDLDGVIG